MNHSGGRLQVMRSRKTACEPAPPTPSTHANVQTSKVSPPRTAPLTNLPCRTRQGKFRIINKTSSTHAAALAVPPAIRPD